jgi:hypothetical protein
VPLLHDISTALTGTLYAAILIARLTGTYP